MSIDTLAASIIAEDRRLKIETKRLEAMKKDLLGMLTAENIGGVDIKEGKITVCTRTSKDFGETIKNLEANLNLTLSKVIEDGKELIPLFGPGFTGMDNLGNSCYMNSVVQVLNSQKEIKDYYTKDAADFLMTCPIHLNLTKQR